jgi:MOSC domain-containing protein YiiM
MNPEVRPHVEHIHVAEAKGAPVRALASAEALAGVGLVGDRYARREGARSASDESQDVTLIEAEVVEALLRSGIELAPGESRRNVTTRGVRLNDLVGKEFWIGDVLARGTELCEPCTTLVALTGKPLIKPLVHRGGLRADLLTSGRISVGDRIAVKDALPG